jgi:hypothetical protein
LCWNVLLEIATVGEDFNKAEQGKSKKIPRRVMEASIFLFAYIYYFEADLVVLITHLSTIYDDMLMVIDDALVADGSVGR